MPTIDLSSGSRIYYKREGRGPALMLIMGTGLDHSVWDAQVTAYREHYDCILFDNPGTGRSTAGKGVASVASLAAEAAELADSLDIESAHVSGLSLGSCIAQELAVMRPELVRSLPLHGTWARADGYAGRKFTAQISLIEKLDMRRFYEINVLWFLTPEFMRRHPDKVNAQIERIVEAAPDKEALIGQYRADLEHDTLERLPQITAPTLVTVGNFDVAVPPMYSREVADAIQSARLVIFEGGGHLHNFEQPDEFNRVTLEFLLGLTE